jgi:uncharacterized caspase-like protein
MNINITFSCVLLLIASALSSTAIAYEDVVPRHALIIGNSDYKFSPLKNPVNDARDMGRKLKSLRYKVTVALDQDPVRMHKVVMDFYRGIEEDNAISLFYYAGHAIQADNINYLIPVNAKITSYESLKSESLSVNELLYALKQAASKQNIIILDACRNNPFEIKKTDPNGRGLAMSDDKLTQLTRGLAPVEAPTGTLVAYATEPGNVAKDGKGRNGTYTAALLKHIGNAETAEALFKKVRREVLATTNNRQTPWEHSSLIETFYFMPPSNKEIPDIISF